MYTLKKSLGQHFLHDKHIIDKIVQALKQDNFHQLLEVGPGGGALTQHLFQLPGVHFKAVELDKEKIEFLSKTYPGLGEQIISGSFLDIDIPFENNFHINMINKYGCHDFSKRERAGVEYPSFDKDKAPVEGTFEQTRQTAATSGGNTASGEFR